MSTPIVPTRLDFFFDVGSAYSYLAATQMDALAARTGLEVRWRPFLLGAVFKATGNVMPAQVAAKAMWMLQDLTLWAEQYGIPFRMSSRFPLVTLRAQRALVAAQRLFGDRAVKPFAMGLFRGMWAEDRDVSDAGEIEAIATAAGLDGAAITAATDAPETKDALRLATEEAVNRGAFGAPAMFLGDTLFWGNDRIGLLETHLARLRDQR